MNNKILVIGDSILDHDVFCEAKGLSLETPTLKTKYSHERYTFGGASNVVSNLLSLGKNVTYVTLLSTDTFYKEYKRWTDNRLKLISIFCNGDNLVKSRYWVRKGSVNYKYFQINRGTRLTSLNLLSTIEKLIKTEKYDCTVLVDYGNGLFAKELEVKKLINLLKKQGIKVISSSQKSDRRNKYHFFKGSDLICMNEEEAASCLPHFEFTEEKMLNLSILLDANVCVTRGEKGSYLLSDGKFSIYRGEKIEYVDSCGAGDAFLASLVATEDLNFANKWAAITVTKLGTHVPAMEDFDEF